MELKVKGGVTRRKITPDKTSSTEKQASGSSSGSKMSEGATARRRSEPSTSSAGVFGKREEGRQGDDAGATSLAHIAGLCRMGGASSKAHVDSCFRSNGREWRAAPAQRESWSRSRRSPWNPNDHWGAEGESLQWRPSAEGSSRRPKGGDNKGK